MWDNKRAMPCIKRIQTYVSLALWNNVIILEKILMCFLKNKQTNKNTQCITGENDPKLVNGCNYLTEFIVNEQGW